MATSTSLLYLVPPIAVLIAYFWVGEIPVASETVGGIVVILGMITIGMGEHTLRRIRARPETALRVNFSWAG